MYPPAFLLSYFCTCLLLSQVKKIMAILLLRKVLLLPSTFVNERNYEGENWKKCRRCGGGVTRSDVDLALPPHGSTINPPMDGLTAHYLDMLEPTKYPVFFLISSFCPFIFFQTDKKFHPHKECKPKIDLFLMPKMIYGKRKVKQTNHPFRKQQQQQKW